MNSTGANIDALVHEVRSTGAASHWPGQAAIAGAVTAIFGDSAIAGLQEADRLDEFAVAVTTSWVLLTTGEECLAGADLNFLGINPNVADGWGVSAETMRLLLLRVTAIYQAPDGPAAAASLAAFIALSLDQQSVGAVAVWSAGRDWFGARAAEAAGWPDSLHADRLRAEFGGATSWRAEEAAALANALAVVDPHCGDEAAERPAPEFPDEPFSGGEDVFFRQMVADRLCRLWTARTSAAMPWPPPGHQVLLPFAGYVRARAASDRTRDLAVLLGGISLSARKEALRRERLLDWISQIPNAGQFGRRLYRRGIVAAPILGALFALVGLVIPDWLAAFVATCGLFAVIRLVSSVRKTAHYTAMTYPVAKSLLAGVLLSALYCAGEAFSLWLQNSDGDGSPVLGLAVSFLVGAGTLTLAVRYGAPFKVSRSVFLPEGAPDELDDQVGELSDKLTEWVSARLESADSSWEELFEGGSSWTPSPLGQPEEAVAATAEAVNMLRRLAQANPTGFDPGFGAALRRYSSALIFAGRPAEAEPVVAEAVQVRSGQVRGNPAYEVALGDELRLLGTIQSDAGRSDEALPTMQRAEQIFRRLAKTNPGPYEVPLAQSQMMIGLTLLKMGRSRDGAACAEEAVRILRLRAEEDAGLRSLLSEALEAIGRILESERPADGLAYAEEAIGVVRALPQANWKYRGDLGDCLMLAGRILLAAGRPEAALVKFDEAVRIFRPLMQANPGSYGAVFALASRNQGQALSAVGRSKEAVASIDEAVRTLRGLVQADPLEWSITLAATLRLQSLALSAAGRRVAALASLDEMVQLLRPLVEKDASMVAPVLADALESQGEVLSQLGRVEHARAAGAEASRIRRTIDTPPSLTPAQPVTSLR